MCILGIRSAQTILFVRLCYFFFKQSFHFKNRQFKFISFKIEPQLKKQKVALILHKLLFLTY
jgi:hypothetical protein